MNASSSLLANPTLPDVSLQLEKIRGGIAQAQGPDSETRLRELKKATQEFEAVFIGYMLKVMRSTVEPADEEGGALGKDIYLSMFDQEIALQMARNSSLGIGEMMYRQLEQTVKDSQGSVGRFSVGSADCAVAGEHGTPNARRQPELPISDHRDRSSNGREYGSSDSLDSYRLTAGCRPRSESVPIRSHKRRGSIVALTLPPRLGHLSGRPSQVRSFSAGISAAMATRSLWSMPGVTEPCMVMLPEIWFEKGTGFRLNRSLARWVAAADRQEHICTSNYRRVASA